MTSMTVKEFALELKLPVKTLLAQLRAAGVSKDAENDVLSDADKSRLLDSLRIERTQTSSARSPSTEKKRASSNRPTLRGVPTPFRLKFVKNASL